MKNLTLQYVVDLLAEAQELCDNEMIEFHITGKPVNEEDVRITHLGGKVIVDLKPKSNRTS